MKKRIPILIYIILLIVLAAALDYNGDVFLYTLFFTVLLYLPVSFLYLLYTKAVLRLFQELEGRKLYKNKPEKYTLVIKNEGPLPIGGIRFQIRDGITLFADDILRDSFELLPWESKEIPTEIYLKYAGSYEAGITEITLQDVFGVIRFRYHVPAPTRVQVMPIVTGKADHVLDQMLSSMRYGRKIVTDAHNETVIGCDIRPYVPGDPVKQIHWKNYARSGELFLRLPDAPNTQVQTVLLLPEPMDDSLSSIERRDFFIEYAVSIANYYARRKKPVSFIIGENSKNRILVEDYTGFDRFYMEITKEMKTTGSGISINEAWLILREKDNTLCLNKNPGS